MTTPTENTALPIESLPETDFMQLMNAMRQEYEWMLRNKVEELESTWNHLLLEWTIEERKRLIRLAHSLAGSAGSYGYPCTGENARALELLLKATHDDTGPSPDQISAITPLLAALHIDPDVDVQGTSEILAERKEIETSRAY